MGKRRFAATASAEASITDASRFGNNHVSTHCRGWNIGVSVHAFVDSDGNDCFTLWTTGGSNSPGTIDYIATVKSDGSIQSTR